MITKVTIAPLDPDGNPTGPFTELHNVHFNVQPIIEATKLWANAIRHYSTQITFTVEATRELLRTLYDVYGCARYAIEAMGLPESDLRSIVFQHPKHPPHVRLLNGRRIPFPPGSPPAIAWGSS